MPYALHDLDQPSSPLAFGADRSLTHLWDDYVVTQVRDVRVLPLSGRTSFSDGKHRVDHVVGLLELTGGQHGSFRTTLHICFSDALVLPPPTFTLAEACAIGTLTLPARSFEPYTAMARARTAHIRIGGDGTRNALATDAEQLLG